MDEIQFSQSDYAGSNPLYFVTYLLDGTQYVNGTSLETYNASHWPQYAISLTLDASTGLYNGDFPLVSNGLYFVTIYEQLTGTASPTDNALADGEYEQLIQPAIFTDQMQIDAQGFISDFAEPITYLSYDQSTPPVLLGTYDINAVVNRNVPEVMQEDGKVLTDSIEINIANDLNTGITVVNQKRDKVICSGRFGGTVKQHSVTLLLSGDAGVWTVRAK